MTTNDQLLNEIKQGVELLSNDELRAKMKRMGHTCEIDDQKRPGIVERLLNITKEILECRKQPLEPPTGEEVDIYTADDQIERFKDIREEMVNMTAEEYGLPEDYAQLFRYREVSDEQDRRRDNHGRNGCKRSGNKQYSRAANQKSERQEPKEQGWKARETKKGKQTPFVIHNN
ncbi:hypothetical protein DdX_13052 [Ditylenchus destructor]|uniref:Uncharacterized protein n=1 Tax=Ditylenchus destructor TaxID=166010 RepID=A0AAD4MUJ3_9BILA|nr:hypothetical protein DdX_13052 [Ditylenchus destructor]